MLSNEPMNDLSVTHFIAVAGVCCLAVACTGDDAAEPGASTSVASDSEGGARTSSSDDAGTLDAGASDDGDATAAMDGTGETSASVSDTTTTDGEDTGTGTGMGTGEEVCSVVLAEVLVDTTLGADTYQWVKLKNLCSYDIDLSTWTIGYAGPNYGDIRQKQLDPPQADPGLDTVIPGYGCFLVGGPTTAAANGGPVFNLGEDFAPGLFSSTKIGSGIALFDVPADLVDEATIPLDAVIYGPNNDAGLMDHTGAAIAQPHVTLPPVGGSITRTDATAQWDLNVAPQAASCPVL